ncbi:hypothetical protein ACFCV3_19575 [Kribbella sp. NPDC056345]|uniref:hypothetical protein n=1 Tax=Kribbella sp. NPDC056345 TaxID=3345789 RepID=UPI0035DEC114
MGGVGSADLRLEVAGEVVVVHTTYLGDGLGSLLRAADALRMGASATWAFLPAEPGGTCLFFGGADDEVGLQIVEFADMVSESEQWSGGRLRWRGRVGVRAFVRGAVVMADEVLVQCGGVDGYLKAWGGIPFPLEQLEALRQGG